jgi:hypothetical protein
MFNQNKVFLLRSLTMKHSPFSDGPADTTGKVAAQPKKKFTYKNHLGQPLSPVKKKYTWSDATKRDKDGKPEGPVIEAVLKSENVGQYNYEEYERNEFERMAIAEGWPVEQVLQMLQNAPDTIEKEIKEQKTNFAKYEKKQADIDGKLNTVIANYVTLFETYDNVRMEVSAMAVELPALKGTPYDRPYFLDLTPIVENMAKINFPDLVKDPAVAPKLKPVPVGETVEAKVKAKV